MISLLCSEIALSKPQDLFEHLPKAGDIAAKDSCLLIPKEKQQEIMLKLRVLYWAAFRVCKLCPGQHKNEPGRNPNPASSSPSFVLVMEDTSMWKGFCFTCWKILHTESSFLYRERHPPSSP
jgi:hypothetical protein